MQYLRDYISEMKSMLKNKVPCCCFLGQIRKYCKNIRAIHTKTNVNLQVSSKNRENVEISSSNRNYFDVSSEVNYTMFETRFLVTIGAQNTCLSDNSWVH